MARMRITAHIHNLISKFRRKGLSARKIAQELNIAKSTVLRHIALSRENDGFSAGKVGRPRKTSKNTDVRVAVAAKRNRFSTSMQLADQFNLSARTIRRRLVNQHLKSHTPCKDPLTAEQKLVRVRWCREHKHTDFNKWIFSDEATFELGELSTPRQQHVRRSSTEKYAECCLLQGGVVDRRKIMIWGAISVEGAVGFQVLVGNVNAHTYIETLQEQLIPYLDNLPLQNYITTTFQHDNAAPHRAACVGAFLEENGVTLAQWPPYSPDINPIEKIWALMKSDISKHRPKTMQELREQIEAGWERVVTPEMCARLFAALPQRVRNVISRKGVRSV